MSEIVALVSVDQVKPKDSSVEELSLSEYRIDGDDIDKETKISISDFILAESLKSADDQHLSIAEVKKEDDSFEEDSSFSECKNDKDSKSFQDQVIEGEKIWKKEDFSLHESCVLCCDKMQLNENTFPGYGKAMEETNVNNCQRCENSEIEGSNLNCRIGNVISENYNNGMCGDKSGLECRIGNHKENTEPSEKTSFKAHIDVECETIHYLSIAEVKPEDVSFEEKSSFSECKNDEDSKSFQDQVFEGKKIWKREDFSLHESCVLRCDKMQLNENTFPGYGKAMEETNVNNCQRCENSQIEGSNINGPKKCDVTICRLDQNKPLFTSIPV